MGLCYLLKGTRLASVDGRRVIVSVYMSPRASPARSCPVVMPATRLYREGHVVRCRGCGRVIDEDALLVEEQFGAQLGEA